MTAPPTVIDEFAGKVVSVTGAAHGIGHSTALAFARRGARLALSDIDADGLAQARKAALAAGAAAVATQIVDIALPDQVAGWFAAIDAEFGGVDCAVNHAGIGEPAASAFGDQTIANFDRVVGVSLPDVAGRRQILGVHCKKIKMAPDVDMEKLARATPMFSGADLAALINEAAIIATMADKDLVEMADLEEARDKVRWGRAKKSRKGKSRKH